MKPTLLDHVWIALTIGAATYSQLVMKWRISGLPAFPADTQGRIRVAIGIFTDPWVLTAFAATFFSGIFWMVVLRKFELSYAFPFTALNFLLMFWIGITVFDERLDAWKLVGTLFVVLGVLMIVIMSSRNT